MGSCCFLFAFLLSPLCFYVGETQGDVAPQEQQCVESFNPGRENFVLYTEEAIKDGAGFLGNPRVTHREACAVACCKDSRCNLALVEHGDEKTSNSSCFLFNCVFKNAFVCRFIKKPGFTNYISESVFQRYLGDRKADEKDKPPIANAGRDMVVQPNEEVFLNGIESWDDEKIIKYEWNLIHGDTSAHIEETSLPDQVKVSNLKPGSYEFKLTVTDSAEHSDSDQVVVLVLTAEQSERHCLTPKKAGPCKGAFSRWHYNAASRECEEFIFGGCSQNKNNYISKRDCLNACQNTTVTPGGEARKAPVEDCSSSCDEDQFKCSNGCCVKKEFECDEQKHCSDGSDEENCQKLNESLTRLLKIHGNERAHCTEPPVMGPCRASFTRWYYDPLVRKCHHFIYGGCDGNENNFNNKDGCMKNCSSVTEQDVFATGVFSRTEGELGESQSASVALAVVLAVAILALLAVLGYCYLKNQRKQQHQRVATSSPPVAYSEDGAAAKA